MVMIPRTFLTKSPEPASLKGLVFDLGETAIKESRKQPWYRTPAAFAIVVVLVFIVLNYVFF
jgi:hypothetical protein